MRMPNLLSRQENLTDYSTSKPINCGIRVHRISCAHAQENQIRPVLGIPYESKNRTVGITASNRQWKPSRMGDRTRRFRYRQTRKRRGYNAGRRRKLRRVLEDSRPCGEFCLLGVSWWRCHHNLFRAGIFRIVEMSHGEIIERIVF